MAFLRSCRLLVSEPRLFVMCARWQVLPDWLWFLVASPALRWAFGPRSDGKPSPWFSWPLPFEPLDGWSEK